MNTMAVLDRVIQMHNQGIGDDEVIKRLSNEGLSIKEINDAVNQSKIKMAVNQQQTAGYSDSQTQQAPQAPYQDYSQTAYDYNQQFSPAYQEQQYAAPQAQSQYPEQYEQQAGYQQQYAPQQYPSMGVDTETITQISEQIINEKLKELKDSMGDIASFKSNTQERISDLNDRLKRIENSLEKIQQAIIGKVGEFGESVAYIHKDLENLHETTSKLMNPLIDNYRAMKGYSSKTEQPTEQKQIKVKKQNSF
jgi:hypothetical protein